MLNHITIMGRLTRDPELRRTGSGTPVASFTVACDRDFSGQDGQKETDFIDCVAWKNTAEFVSSYFTKGRMMVVDGRLQIRNWTDKDGNKRKTAEIVADHVYFGDSKPEGNNHGGGYNPPASNYQGGNSYGGAQQGFGTPAPESFPGYPAQPDYDYSQNNFDMRADDDNELPF